MSYSIPTYVQDNLSRGEFVIDETLTFPHASLDEFDGFYITPTPRYSSHEHELTSEVGRDDTHRAWMYADNTARPESDKNHRAYPTIQIQNISGKTEGFNPYALIDFECKVDVDLVDVTDKDWVSLATWETYSDNTWPRATLLNIDKDYGYHLQHLHQTGDSHPATGRVTMTQGAWTRIVILLCFERHPGASLDSWVYAWADGTLVAQSSWTNRYSGATEAANSITHFGGLTQFHAGLYAPPALDDGQVWNDNLYISQLSLQNGNPHIANWG